MAIRLLMLALFTFSISCVEAPVPVIAETTAAQPSGQTNGGNAVKTIFDYKSELRLTDDQEQRMRQILVNLNKELQVERAKLTILSYDLDELIRKEADLDQIKRTLHQEADLRASIAYADLAAGRQINGTLTSDQLNKWRQIQTSARQAVASASEVKADEPKAKKK